MTNRFVDAVVGALDVVILACFRLSSISARKRLDHLHLPIATLQHLRRGALSFLRFVRVHMALLALLQRLRREADVLALALLGRDRVDDGVRVLLGRAR